MGSGASKVSEDTVTELKEKNGISPRVENPSRTQSQVMRNHGPVKERVHRSAHKRQKQHQNEEKTKSNHRQDSLQNVENSDSDTALDSTINEIVANVESAEKADEMSHKKKTRRGLRGLFGGKNAAHSAPDAARPVPFPTESSPSAPITGTRVVANGKLGRRPATRHGRSRSEEQIQAESEWEYKKVVIDGFDPEKFKKANLNKKPLLPNQLSGISLDSIGRNDFATYSQNDPVLLRVRKTEMQHMALSPAYDVTEEQLMKSIEQEYSF